METIYGGSIERVYDPKLHDGELEGPYAICEDSDGNVIDVDDDPEFLEFGDYFSVMIHCIAGGTERIGNFHTVEDARAYMDGPAAAFLKSKGH